MLPAAVRAEQAWIADGSEDGVQVWYRQEPGKRLRTWRAETVIPGPLRRIVKILDDASGYKNWWYLCREYRQLSSSEDGMKRLGYMVSDLPFPYGDRDVPVRVESVLSEDHRLLTIRNTVQHEAIPPQSGRVRVHDQNSTMILEQLDNGSVRFEFINYQDPEGIPALLVNPENRTTMIYNLVHLRTLVEESPGLSEDRHKP